MGSKRRNIPQPLEKVVGTLSPEELQECFSSELADGKLGELTRVYHQLWDIPIGFSHLHFDPKNNRMVFCDFKPIQLYGEKETAPNLLLKRQGIGTLAHCDCLLGAIDMGVTPNWTVKHGNISPDRNGHLQTLGLKINDSTSKQFKFDDYVTTSLDYARERGFFFYNPW